MGLGWGLWATAPRLLSAFLTSTLGSRVQVERVSAGWKSLRLEGLVLLGKESDTLAHVHRVSLQWRHLDLAGGTHHLSLLEIDTVVLNIIGQSGRGRATATN